METGRERDNASGPDVRTFVEESKILRVLACLGLVVIIGVLDYLTGFELSFFAFYLIPIVLAGWTVGPAFGIVVSILCAGASVGSDWVAGARYSNDFVPIWNAVVLIAAFSVVTMILIKLRSLYNKLEERVRERTAALHAEMHERTRLEEEILRISEHEQVRIGHDLHDSLCQHLTATAIAGQVLGEQLADSPPQAKAANTIANLIEEAIELTRRLARGLSPVELQGEGLFDGLRELAALTKEHSKIDCQFDSVGPVTTLKHEVAIHLYRIAQEATSNAIRHGHAKRISICIESSPALTTLTISDDGKGLPADTKDSDGMGLRIMAHRAALIGAAFKAESLPAGGTRVTCALSGEKNHSQQYLFSQA